VLDGLRTLKGRSGQGVFVPPPGNGPDIPLAWALQEVSEASRAPSKQEQSRLCTNAILNARRALACLADWYLRRDLADCCKNRPTTPKQQAEFLMRRGIIDELTSHVLERAVEKRNRVEHAYVVPDLATAEDLVELLRRIMAAIRSQSNPEVGPWIFGIFLGGYGFGKNGAHAHFCGWGEPLTVFSRFPPRPWVGLVLPNGEADALVRRAYLDSTTAEELLELLAHAEQKYGRTSSWTSLEICEVLGRELKLIE
jgi:uncharacterized protein YutE (UPF0331/DUF86 family)